MHAACVEIQRIIPFDETAGIFDNSTSMNLEGTGKGVNCTLAYNNYYRKIVPKRPTCITDWRNYDGLEFAVDYMFPNHMYKTLADIIPGHLISLRIQRSRYSPDFSEADVEALDLVSDWLNTFSMTFDKGHDPRLARLSPERTAERFTTLTPREAAVCSLIARRFTTAEIATCLLVEGRTVQKHLEAVFAKLQVVSRDQLRWRLGEVPSVCDGSSAEECGALTPREAEVFRLVRGRLSTAEIAAYLGISPRTVEKHVERVLQKLNVRSRLELASRVGTEASVAFPSNT